MVSHDSGWKRTTIIYFSSIPTIFNGWHFHDLKGHLPFVTTKSEFPDWSEFDLVLTLNTHSMDARFVETCVVLCECESFEHESPKC